MSDVAIPDGWTQVKLGDVCVKIGSGATPTGGKSVYVASGFPFIRSQNIGYLQFLQDGLTYIVDRDAKKLRSVTVKPQDILINITGFVARCCMTPDFGMDAFVSQHVCILRTDSSIVLSRFLVYVINYQKIQQELLTIAAAGATRDAITKAHLEALKIPCPPLHEQKAIAHILGTLDDKIDQLRKTNSVLEDMASALFKSWFVDFDPVKAKQENRPTGLPEDLDDLFPDSFEDSALGPIPTGWRVSKTGDELTVVGGTTPSTSNPSYWDGGSHYWATPKDLSEQKLPIISSTSRLVTDQGLATISSRLLDPGSVLLSSRAPVGYLAVAEVPVAINQGFIAIKASLTTPTGFIYEWCKGNIEEFLKRSSGTTFLELSKSSFRQISLVMPEADVVREYECHHTGLFKRVSSNIHQIRTLTNLRDTLLPKLISGDLRVPDAEQMVAELGL